MEVEETAVAIQSRGADPGAVEKTIIIARQRGQCQAHQLG